MKKYRKEIYWDMLIAINNKDIVNHYSMILKKYTSDLAIAGAVGSAIKSRLI